jgi:hypothetical protein
VFFHRRIVRHDDVVILRTEPDTHDLETLFLALRIKTVRVSRMCAKLTITKTPEPLLIIFKQRQKGEPLYVRVLFQKKPMLNMDECRLENSLRAKI